MKKVLFPIILCLLATSGFATVVNIHPIATGSTDGATVNMGTINVSNPTNRGFGVFDLSSAGIPAGSTITSVTLTFSYTNTGSSIPVDTIFGYGGNITTAFGSASALYNACVSTNRLYTTSWGHTASTVTMATNANAVSFISAYLSGSVSLAWVLSGSANTYAVTGGASPTLSISYSCSAPSILGIYASSTNICEGAALTISTNVTGAATYLWTGPGGYTSTDRNPSPITMVRGNSGSYHLVASSLCGASVSNNTPYVTINRRPGTISGTFSSCVGGTVTLSDTTSGGTWSSSATTKATVNSSTGVVTAIAGGTANISYTIVSCPAAVVAFNSVATPAAITGINSACVGGSNVLHNTSAFGIWTSANPSIATVNSSTGLVNAISQGVATITYATGCGSPATTTFTSKTVPAAISGTLSICPSSTTTLSDITPNGSWSSVTPSVATVNSATGVVNGLVAGSTTINYSTGCGAAASVNLIVKGTPAAITGTTTICRSTSTTLHNTSAGGTWSSANSAIASINASTGVMTGVAAGNTTISYGNGCGAFSTIAVTIKAVPTAIVGPSTVCVGATITLTDTALLGSWSSSGAMTRASVGASTGIVTGIGAGGVNITYSNSCGTAAVKTLTVNATPAAIGGSPSVCTGAAVTLNDATNGGSWASSNTSLVTINSASGVATGVSQGIATISYTKTGCTVTRAININTAPGAITGSALVCNGTPVTLSNSAINGTWSSSTTGVATVGSSNGVVVAASSYGTANINYSTGCGSTASYAITVKSTPTVISGLNIACIGVATTLTNGSAGGTWSSSNPTIAVVNPATGVVSTVFGVSLGSVTIAYSTGCGTDATKPMSVHDVPGVISGSSISCIGNTNTLTNTAANGIWTSSTPSVASIDLNTGVVSGMSHGNATIVYSTGCGTDATSLITVNDAPQPIGGSNFVCLSGLTALNDLIPGGTWTSSNPLIATVNTTNGIVTGMSTGTTNINYSTGCGIVAIQPITVRTVPAAILGASNVCSGSVTTMSETIANGTWSSSSPFVATVDSVTGVVTGVAIGTSSISYSTGCGVAAVKFITTDVVPTLPSGITNICTGNSTLFSDIVPGGTWSSTLPLVASVSPAGLVTGISEGSSNIQYTLSNACGLNTVALSTIVSQTGKWIGVNSNWNDASNWPCGIVPDTTVDVTIPASAAHVPDFTGLSLNVRKFTVDPLVNITVPAGATINATTIMTINGTVTGAGTVSLSGSTPAQLRGNGFVSNVSINSAAGVTIPVGNNISINGTLNVQNGTLTTNGGLTLTSTATSTGRIGILGSGTNILGNVTIQQYIPGGQRAYRFFGHPFSTYINLSQLTSSIDITGLGGAANGFTTTATNAASAFWYHTSVGNSSLGSDPGWKAFTSCYGAVDTNKFRQYEGIRLYIRGTRGQGLDGAPYTPSPVTISMTGPLNVGSQNIPLHKGVTSDYNQVSNPLPSPVNIGAAIARAHTNGQITGTAFYVWNPYLGTSGAFEAKTIGGSYNIETNSSFQVRAAYEGATLAISEADKVATANETLLRTASQTLDLNIYDVNYHLFDKLAINFDDKATENEDADNDATKAMNPDMNFYSLSANNSKLCIDGRPYTDKSIIPLGINSNYAQEFIIKIDNNNIPAGGSLYLVDKFLNKSMQVESGAEYRFAITEDANSQGDKRFELRAGTIATENTEVASNELHLSLMPNPATDQVTVSFNGTMSDAASINVLDISGVNIFNKDLGVAQNGSVSIALSDLATGVYFVELKMGDRKLVQILIKN